MRRRLLACIALLIFVFLSLTFFLSTSAPEQLVAIELSFTREGWPGQIRVTDESTLALVARHLHRLPRLPSYPSNYHQPMYSLCFLFEDNVTLTLGVTYDLRFYDLAQGHEIVPNQALIALVVPMVEQLKEQAFGRLADWREADQLFARFTTATITDIETGLSFRTQRRGGTYHADIQPLTKGDTAILKEIYGGKWSWSRRAVLLQVDDHILAASMNGMPHGHGALTNNFPGHHCLHFVGSTTHGSRNTDPAHQLMAHKAAGQVHEYLRDLSPEQLQVAMLAMAGQGEGGILLLGIVNAEWNPEAEAEMYARLVPLRQVTVRDARTHPASEGVQEVDYVVSVYFEGDQKEYRTSITLTSRYFGNLGQWLVEPGFLDALLKVRETATGDVLFPGD